jgi:hypothetical protein
LNATYEDSETYGEEGDEEDDEDLDRKPAALPKGDEEQNDEEFDESSVEGDY